VSINAGDCVFPQKSNVQYSQNSYLADKNLALMNPSKVLALLLPGLAAVAPSCNVPETRRMPNIVFILADDMGYGDVSALNNRSKITTPHIDRIATSGVTFTDAHSSSAVCTPTRYSILTGRYNWRSSLKRGVLDGYSKALIPASQTTMASMLRQQGYHTACIGKWHLGWDWAGIENGKEQVDYSLPIQNGPTSLGFDYFYGFSGSLDMPPYVYVENNQPTAPPDRVTKGNNTAVGMPGSGGWSYPRPGAEEEGLPPFQLYNLATDPGETTNLADKYPEKVNELNETLSGIVAGVSGTN